MADTCFITRDSKGVEKKHRTACFSQFLGNNNPYKDLQFISLNHEHNAPVYEQKEFLKLVSKAFPKGLVSENGWVTYRGFKGDLVVYAAITLRHPGEYNYSHMLPNMMAAAEKSYKKLENPGFKLTAPLMCCLMNIPRSVTKDKIIPYASDGHCAVHWGSLNHADLWYLGSINHFEGVQKVIGDDVEGWRSGYSSVPREPKRKLNGLYISQEKNKFTDAFRGFIGSNPDSYYANYRGSSFTPEELYDFVFNQMMSNKPE